MNEQLPPVDPALRDQLTRRSAGRRPAALLDEVFSAVDSAPVSAGFSAPVVGLAAFRRNPRVSGALVGLAAAVVLVAAMIAVPALRSGPAASSRYPTDRALTTAELADVMAGTALATNTALVADVTITANPDVCPMNRYPTIGVIEGMKSQVCVMAASVTYDLKPAGAGHATYAFRYLAPGVLGLLGEITPAASGLAHKVTEEWPAAPKTFVVDGWLGAQGLALPCASIAAGDPLNPTDQDCPSDNWLSDDPSAPDVNGQLPLGTGTQALDLHGRARFVVANAARQFDSIDGSAPVHGQFVVKSQTVPCEGQSPASSVGCSYWLVLAKLGDVSVPTTTPTTRPSATVPPLSGYPTERALTTVEFGQLLDAGALKPDDTVVVDAQLEPVTGGCPIPDSLKPMNLVGSIAGISSTVCVYSASKVNPGYLVLRMGGARSFEYVGAVTAPGPGAGLAHSAAASWPTSGSVLVTGWLQQMGLAGNDPAACPHQTPDADGNVNCQMYWLSDSADRNAQGAAYIPVEQPTDGPALAVGPGTFVVTSNGTACPTPQSSPDSCAAWTLQAKLTELVGSLHQPPATPVPELTPTPSPIAQSTPHPGYPFDRALSTAELAKLASDPTTAAGTTFIANAIIQGSGVCDGSLSWGSARYALAGTNPQVCLVAIGAEQPTTGVQGIFAFRSVSAGVVSYLGQVETPNATNLLYTPNGGWPITTSDTKTFVVGGYLVKTGNSWSISGRLGEAGQSVTADPSASDSAVQAPGYGVWIVQALWVAVPATSAQPAPGDGVQYNVVGRVDDAAITTSQAATSAAPTSALGTAATWGSGNRPLTVTELASLWRTGKLAGRTVITKGPVPASAACLTADGLDQCNYAIAGAGYWVVRFDAANKPSVVGQLTTPKAGYMWTAESLNTTVLKSGSLLVMDGSLVYDPTCVDPAAQCSTSQIMGKVNMRQSVNEGAYQTFSGGSTAGDDIAGPFLIQLGEPSTVVGRLEPVTP